MNITKVRAVTKKRVTVDSNLERIKARHTREREREAYSRHLSSFKRAVELASTLGESEALIENIWCRDLGILERILKVEFKAFETSFQVDGSKGSMQMKCYIVRISW